MTCILNALQFPAETNNWAKRSGYIAFLSEPNRFLRTLGGRIVTDHHRPRSRVRLFGRSASKEGDAHLGEGPTPNESIRGMGRGSSRSAVINRVG